MSTWGIGSALFKTGCCYEEYKKAQAQSSHQSGFLDCDTIIPLHPPSKQIGDLADRVVGVVRKELLGSFPKKGSYYAVTRRLADVFGLDVLEQLNNLEPSCQNEPTLPDGTGIAIAGDLVITAGHVVPLASPSSYVVVQFKIAGDRLHQDQVYEIEKYLDTRCGTDSPNMTVEAYESNLKGGDWAILKLKKPICGAGGPLGSLVGHIADNPQVFTSGREVMTFGHPHGLPLRQAEGKITHFDPKDPMVVKYEAETLPGMSGGPVFDKATGQLIGLHLRGHLTLAQYNGPNLRVLMLEPVDRIKSILLSRGLFGEFFQSVIPVMERVRQLNESISKPAVSASAEERQRLEQVEKEKLAALKALAEKERQAKAKEQEIESLRKQLAAAQQNASSAPKNASGAAASPAPATSAPAATPPRPNPPVEGAKTQAVRGELVSSIAFGAADWKKYFGDVGQEPPLPANIETILNGPCPIWSGKKVKETHLLVLVPNTVNGKLFTLDFLEQLIQHPQTGGHETKYKDYDKNAKAQHGSTPAPASHWVLMTRDVVMRSETYDFQKRGVAQYASYGYELPRALEAATAILMEHVKTGNRLYIDNPMTSIRCQELNHGKYPLMVGCFSPDGLCVFDSREWEEPEEAYDDDFLAVLRRFATAAEQNAGPALTATAAPAATPSQPNSQVKPTPTVSSAPAATPPRPSPPMEGAKTQAVRGELVSSIAFGAADWKRYFGDVGQEPPLPANIETILNGPCPIWSGKKVKETHLLVLVPNTVDGKPFTLDFLEQLIQHPQTSSHETKYKNYNATTKAQHGSTPAPASHWVLMTRDVVEETRNKTYDDQKKVVAQYASYGYEPPRVLEAATAILMEHIKTGNRLYTDSPLTHTCCQEQVEYQGTKYPLVVGGFAPGGLVVDRGYSDGVGFVNRGLAVLRKFATAQQNASPALTAISAPAALPSKPNAQSNSVPTTSSALPALAAPNSQVKPTPTVSSVPTATPAQPKPPAGMVSRTAFGAADWKKYFGDVGEEPPLSANMEKILSSPCPFESGKKIYETHLLTLIPRRVQGELFTLNLLDQLVQKPQGGGHAAKFRYYDQEVKTQYGDAPASESHWVLITKNVIEGTTEKSYEDQKVVMAQQDVQHNHELPRILEVATALLMDHVKTGNRLYPNTYTRCQEQIDRSKHPLIVGGFTPGGLMIYSDSNIKDNCGLAAMLKY